MRKYGYKVRKWIKPHFQKMSANSLCQAGIHLGLALYSLGRSVFHKYQFIADIQVRRYLFLAICKICQVWRLCRMHLRDR